MHTSALRQIELMPILGRTVDERFRTNVRFLLGLQPVNFFPDIDKYSNDPETSTPVRPAFDDRNH